MREVRAEHVRVRGGRLSVRAQWGDRVTLVFLHGWGGSRHTFAPVINRLESGCGVVSYDQRGWGAAQALPGPYGLEQLADDVAQVIGQLDMHRYVLVGHSMGGKVAQMAASLRPEGLTGLALVAPAPPRPADVTRQMQDALSHACDDPTTVKDALEHVLTYRPLPESLREQVITDSLAVDDGARLAWPLHGIAENVSEAVGAIEVPVRVFAGEQDRVDPPASLAEHLLPFIPTSCMTVVGGTGHLSPLEVPDKIAGLLDRFVNDLTAPGEPAPSASAR